MAMVKCRECDKEVSSKAKTCPNCGVKNPQPQSKFNLYLKLALGAFLVISMVKCINEGEDKEAQEAAEAQRIEASKTPEQRAKEAEDKAKSEAEFQSSVRRLQLLKSSSKNPKSFEVVDAILMNDGTLCVTYRGTNSYNAVVTDSTAISKNMKVVNWNKFCAGKSGRNMKSAQYAL
jgi:hypothetical protein